MAKKARTAARAPKRKAASKAKAPKAKVTSKRTKAAKAKAPRVPLPKKTAEQSRAEKQTLAMWALLGNGGESLASKLKPRLDKPEREALRTAGLISVPEKRGGNIVITERGWHWANDHLSDPLPDSNTGAVVLQAWLTRLHAFMKAKGFALVDVFATAPQNEKARDPATRPPLDYPALCGKIRKAYLAITAGQWSARALLRDIREALSDIDRSTLDDALLRMQRDEQVSLMRLDNQFELTNADDEAALLIGNEPRHILWISR